MLVSAPRRQPITHVLVAIALVSACSKQSSQPAPSDDNPAGSGTSAQPGDTRHAGSGSAAATTAGAKPVDGANEQATNRIVISAAPPRDPARPTLARRCVLGGDPLASACVGGGEGIAVGKGGLVYVVAGTQVRRYQRADGDACRLEPSGEPIELPPDNPRPQKLGGPVYMRSGGAAWHLVRAGAAVYAHDFLGGLFRIDRGKPEPTCDDVFGFNTVAAHGKRLLVARNGIEELKPGKQCKAVPARIDDKARGELYAIADHLYLASHGKVSRYEGGKRVELGEGTRICSVSALTACGDGACIVDNNCMQVVQLGADGKVLRVLDDDKLFVARPWSLAEAARGERGEVYVLARHRDKTNDKEICEAAIYELPAAVFAL